MIFLRGCYFNLVGWNHVKIIENRYVERITLSPSLSNHDGSFTSLSRFPSEPMIVGGYLLKQKNGLSHLPRLLMQN